eukprot:c6849_g1_i1.p1 GENE.c6849_g1_i1~~c6849_g1_i1.p1  ORF type:complete len:466 (-),score=117.63 c6849_g1_i1:1292-2689(-)
MKVFVLFAVVCVLLCSADDHRWGKISERLSLRKPFNDASNNWKLGGSASIQGDVIKILPQSQRQSGYVWSQKPVQLESWEVIFEFGVHGVAPLSTGEGIAFWHVSETSPGSNGAVYGHSDRFGGLGIFFDSYDSDGNGEAESYVLAMYNDGTKTIDQEGAGVQLGVCFADFRNLPHPARAKITYSRVDTLLTVGLDIENKNEFKSCISVKDVNLDPATQHFGLSVSDYGSDFEVFGLTGIDIAAGQTASSDPTVVEVKQDTSGPGGQPAFESHTHFQRIVSRLKEISDRLLSLKDQFDKQFDAVFHNHNKALEHYVYKMQLDLNTKHQDNKLKVDSAINQVSNMHHTVQAMATALAKEDKSESQLQSLTQIKVSCAQDNHRSQIMVNQLKDTVTTLHKRQDEIFADVKSNLGDISADLSSGCGADSVKPVLATLVGVILGALIAAQFKSNKRHNHHHHRTGAFGV